MPIDYVPGDDHVVTITINRPEARNSLDMEHFFQLRSAWDRFGEDDDAYVAIVTGVGQGLLRRRRPQDLHPPDHRAAEKMKAGEVPSELGGYRLDDGVKAVLRGTKLYKPIIAAVNGTCVAGGMEMLGGTDLRVASDTATFGVMEPKRGLVRRRRHHGAPPPPDPLPRRHGAPAVRRSDPAHGPTRWACSTRCAARPT